MTERQLVLAAVVVFFFLGLVLPVARLWRRERVFGVVLHRVLAAGMSAWLLGILAWGIAVALGAPLGPAPFHHVGWAFVATGLAVLVRAQAQMGAAWRIGIDPRPTGLVTHGLYAVVRNPIYSAMSLMLLGLCLVTPSPVSWALWAVTTAVAAVQTRREEAHLQSLHGDRYRQYAARTGRFLPFVGRLTPQSGKSTKLLA